MTTVYLAVYNDYDDHRILGVFATCASARAHLDALDFTWDEWETCDGTQEATLTYGPRFLGSTATARPGETRASIEAAARRAFDPAAHFGIDEYEVQP